MGTGMTTGNGKYPFITFTFLLLNTLLFYFILLVGIQQKKSCIKIHQHYLSHNLQDDDGRPSSAAGAMNGVEREKKKERERERDKEKVSAGFMVVIYG